MRALGHGFRVCVIQFIKGVKASGEILAVKRFEDLLDVHVMGRGFTWTSKNLELDKKIAAEAWHLAHNALCSDDYKLVVLDELTYLIKYGFVDMTEIVEGLQRRREDLHVVVTGRDAPQALIDAADLVTDMREIKHPFKQGIKAQRGVEF